MGLLTTQPGFIQSELRCVGKAPLPIRGRCDEELIREAWKCSQADFSTANLAYRKSILDEIVSHCHARPGTPPSVLMLGLGGGIIPTFLETHCPGVQVLSVEKDRNMVAAA